MTLDGLIAARRELKTDLTGHLAAMEAFWPGGNSTSFRLFHSEAPESESAKDSRQKDETTERRARPPHMTSSASCYQAIADLTPGTAGGLPVEWRYRAQSFADSALATDPKDWVSEEGAHIYCRVRALPAAIRYTSASNANDELAQAALSRLREAFSVILDQPLTDAGLREQPLDATGAVRTEIAGYPPNGFHAYWGHQSLRLWKTRFDVSEPAGDLDELAEHNIAWCRSAVGCHTALLNAGKLSGDAQQLAYAVLVDVDALEGPLVPASEEHDLYSAALAAFFREQRADGSWPLSKPLFHYPASGNAYCWPFETLAELLRPALPRERGRTFRALLEPYLPHLFTAWAWAQGTRVPLVDAADPADPLYGWSSSHRATLTGPESWATAGVYAFGQMLRCMSGHVVAERAARELGVRRPAPSTPRQGAAMLAQRGRTWAPDGWTVARDLAALFLHPRQLEFDDPEIRDPDRQVVVDPAARSAVLFGPPGTGKTTLVEALAAALGWEFIEVLASDFLSAGVDQVPARADAIFERLMQADRCVVLFDEIDELIRDRSAEQSDPFGRFLTTSMLPKIAKLWKQGRVVFFVNTNHVAEADTAITRSSRFDARILVAPPGLEIKLEALGLASDVVTASELRTMINETAKPGVEAKDEHDLIALPLLRHDQIPELNQRLENNGKTRDGLIKALHEMIPGMLRHDWRSPVLARPPSSQADDLPANAAFGKDAHRLAWSYEQYRRDVSHDGSRLRVARLEDLDRPSEWATPPPGSEITDDALAKAGLALVPAELPARASDGNIRIASLPGDDSGILHWRNAAGSASGATASGDGTAERGPSDEERAR